MTNFFKAEDFAGYGIAAVNDKCLKLAAEAANAKIAPLIAELGQCRERIEKLEEELDALKENE